MGMLIRLGLGPASTYLMTATGRRTGRARTTPVTLVEGDGDRWLVAPYGPVGWVHNVRAEPTVTLRRGRRRTTLTATEVDAQVAARILKRYVASVPVVRPYFDVEPEAPIPAYVEEAARHPVFALRAPERV
jgi:deazaflavin-dependent oxidoreductase (nitroreductase family)